jgi:hypothetical protein
LTLALQLISVIGFRPTFRTLGISAPTKLQWMTTTKAKERAVSVITISTFADGVPVNTFVVHLQLLLM